MIVRSQAGMLSSGVLPPDSMFIGSATSMIQQAELRHRTRDRAEEDADRGREEEIERDARHEERDRADDRTPKRPRTTISSESPTATVMTSAFAQTLASAISNGVSGIISR